LGLGRWWFFLFCCFCLAFLFWFFLFCCCLFFDDIWFCCCLFFDDIWFCFGDAWFCFSGEMFNEEPFLLRIQYPLTREKMSDIFVFLLRFRLFVSCFLEFPLDLME